SKDSSKILIGSSYGCVRIIYSQGDFVCSDSGYSNYAMVPAYDSSVDSILFQLTVTDTSKGADSAFAQHYPSPEYMAKKSGSGSAAVFTQTVAEEQYTTQSRITVNAATKVLFTFKTLNVYAIRKHK
ncbi:hypothetical protein, partial [Escherichia coli]|uniref:hypothetical protein n=1 Tax=Escherichia coli TaxID=562 RepID=UPI001BC836E0